MFARFRRRIGLIGLLAVVLVSGAHGAPADNASTDRCLAFPSSPAPEGSHWFYRVDLQSAVKCWYLRMTGQTEQKAATREKPATAARATTPHATAPHETAAHTTASHTAASHTTASHANAAHVTASHVQLIRRSSSSILGADSTGSDRPINLDDSAIPAPDVGIDAPGVALQSKASRGAPAGETFARTAPVENSSPSIEVIRVRNSNELQMGDEVPGPRQPVRVVWPALGSEAQPAAVSKADAKDQTALLVRTEPDVATGSGTESSAAGPGEGTSGASRIGKLAVLIFLSFGLPGAGILAWLVMRADNARGEQFTASHVRLNRAEDPRSRNQRRARARDNRREADWLDDFLADLAEQPTPARRNAGRAPAGPVPQRADVADVVLRDILLAFRRKAATGYDSSGYAARQRRMAAR